MTNEQFERREYARSADLRDFGRQLEWEDTHTDCICYMCGEILHKDEARNINGEPHCPVCYSDQRG